MTWNVNFDAGLILQLFVSKNPQTENWQNDPACKFIFEIIQYQNYGNKFTTDFW